MIPILTNEDIAMIKQFRCLIVEEFIELMPTKLDKSLFLLWSNKITDVKTIIGILWYQKIVTGNQ